MDGDILGQFSVFHFNINNIDKIGEEVEALWNTVISYLPLASCINRLKETWDISCWMDKDFRSIFVCVFETIGFVPGK